MKRLFWSVLFIIVAGTAVWASGSPEELGPGLYARINSSRGSMVFFLDYQRTPLTVANFAGLAKGVLSNSARTPGTPYYDGMDIYREAPGYAVFIGDPSGSGEGGPGYSLPRETGALISAGEPGVLVMDGFATESSGSRFFITVAGDEFLDSKYTSFGRIVSGSQVLKKLRLGDQIESVEILQIGEEAEGLSIDQEIFDRLLSSGRKAEVDAFESIDPNLAEAIRDLGTDREKTVSGVYYSVLREGEGALPKSGDQVSMHYTGYLLDGTVFDSSRPRGQTFDIVLGRDGIIPGWIEMVVGMKAGEIRQVVIPPEMAYGEFGYGPIEPDSWLVFEMELVSIVEG